MTQYFSRRKPKPPAHKEIFGFSEPEDYERPTKEEMIDYFNPDELEDEEDGTK